MKTRFLWLTVVLLLSVTGGFASPQATQTSDAAPALVPAASPTPLARPTPPPVVPYEALLPFLPATPEGWTAEKPAGSTTDIDIFKLSTVTQTYQKGDQENVPVVTVTIIDAGGHKGYFEASTALWKGNAETPDGYDKTVEIDGMPGYEHFKKEANGGSLSVVAGGRYFIQIEVTNLDQSELRVWLKKIDFKKLAQLK
ncbi:MAG: hypothetical protein WCO68_07735 [Verrucomicrobiota bacterium]